MGYAQLAEGTVERLQLTEVLDQSVAMVWPPGAGFSIRVHRDYAPAIPPLLGHRGHFGEICTNLLINAAEAMNGQGEVFLSVQAGDDYSVVLRVRDTGPGIAPELHQRIFESYSPRRSTWDRSGMGIVNITVNLWRLGARRERDCGQGPALW